MKKPEFHDSLEAVVPEVPPFFSQAVRESIAGLVRCEVEKEETSPMKPILNKRRTLTFVLAALLLLAAVATAATLLSRNVFDVTMGDTPTNATSFTQHDLAKETVGNAEITIKEAAYDGMSLYIVYSIRDLTATELFGAADDSGERRLRQEDYARIEKLNVGWWWDNLWIDSKKVNMPNMSGGDELPGDQPGETLYYMQYRLDQENVFLDGKNVEISYASPFSPHFSFPPHRMPTPPAAKKATSRHRNSMNKPRRAGRPYILRRNTKPTAASRRIILSQWM